MDDRTKTFHPIEVQLGAAAFYVSPGSRVEIPFVIINYSGQEGYFDLSVQGVPESWVLLDIPVIHLDGQERRQASLTIQAPDNSPGSEGVYPVSLRATSQLNPQQWGESGFDLRVGATGATIPMEVTEPKGVYRGNDLVGVRMDTLQYTVSPGESLAIPVVVANQSANPETYYISVEGLPPSWVSLPMSVLTLTSAEQRELTLIIQPPQAPASRAGRHPFRVRITSQSNPAQPTILDAILTIAAVNQFSSEITPRHMDAGRTARLRIFNLSNIQDTYSVQFFSQGAELEFVPTIKGPVRVPPGEMTAVDFAVSPVRPNWFSSPVMLPYTVQVRSSEGETQSHAGEVVSRSLIPIWVLPALLALCVTFACGLGFLWNWNQNRLADATRTVAAQVAIVRAQTTTAVVVQQTATALALLGVPSTGGTPSVPTPTTALTNTLAPTNPPEPSWTPLIPTFTPIAPTNTFTPAPTVTNTATLPPAADTLPPPTATNTATVTPPPPTSTFTVVPPTATNTLAPPTATFTLAPAPTLTATIAATVAPTANSTASATPGVATATLIPLPVTGAQQIVFVSNRDGNPQLYLFNTSNDSITRLTSTAGADTQPAWSPDGTRLVFTSNRDGNNEIYVMNADGANPVNLTNNAANDEFPTWSPDGTRIAFTTNRDGNNEIYVMNADGSNPVNLTKSPANDFKPAWFAQRIVVVSTNRILFTSDRDGNNEIYSVNLDGSRLTNLTRNPANDSLPAVTHSGGAVAFVSDRDGNSEIYTMGLDGANPTNVSKNPAADTNPAWSPDGKWLVFTTDRDGANQVYLMAANGATPARLTVGTSLNTEPTWK